MTPPGDPPAAAEGLPAAEASHHTKGLVRLTMACNERCPFCNVPQEDYARPTPPEADVQAQLDAFVATGQGTLTVSGGEPTLLRRRLVGLVRQARSRGIPFVEVQTNAVLVTPDYAAELAAAGLTSAFVSLLSDQPALHDELAGLEGAFPRCLAGIDAFVAAGVRVTLNPVVARSTQSRVAAYVAFVAERLPAVRTISLSAVQPHGRAGRGEAAAGLLPDYDVLAAEVPRARAVAAAAGIELLNPYCGLPLCVGWVDDPSRSVEAIEAADRAGSALGVENHGDKLHGPACRDCAWRTRCGGAWRLVWEERGGRGIVAPARSVVPWAAGAAEAPFQTVVVGTPGPDERAWEALAAARTPTVWLHVGAFTAADAARIGPSGCTDLALDLDPAGLVTGAGGAIPGTLSAVAAVLREQRDASPARQVRVFVRVRRGRRTSEGDQAAVVAWARVAGVDRLQVVRPGR